MPMEPNTYDPANFKALTFHDRLRDFEDGSDSPRAYLERCLETVAAEEPVVQAFAFLDEDLASAAADESSARWKGSQPLQEPPTPMTRTRGVPGCSPWTS